MSFKKELEQYLEQISVLEESFRKVRDLDTLPVSFFSASLDILNQLKTGLYELESSQLQMMAAHLDESKEKLADEPAVEGFTGESIVKDIKEVKENVSVFLGDKIGKKIYADLTKSLTINQRFMFLRDLFNGNETEMNQTLTHLNALKTLEDALDYLENIHPVQWETESGMAFKELLEKRFV
jgi:cell division protein YceG involved in septum cleavage